MRIRVKVIPNAKRSSVEKLKDYYKVRVDAPPIRGKANKRLTEILAKHFNVPRSKIRIVKGQKLRMKEVEVE